MRLGVKWQSAFRLDPIKKRRVLNIHEAKKSGLGRPMWQLSYLAAVSGRACMQNVVVLVRGD